MTGDDRPEAVFAVAGGPAAFTVRENESNSFSRGTVSAEIIDPLAFPGDGSSGSDVEIGDIDGDGRLDLIITLNGAPDRIYYQRGG